MKMHAAHRPLPLTRPAQGATDKAAPAKPDAHAAKGATDKAAPAKSGAPAAKGATDKAHPAVPVAFPLAIPQGRVIGER